MQERVRVGALGRTWLELAAQLGHGPACRALGESLRVELPSARDPQVWEAWLGEAWRPGNRRALKRLDSGLRQWLTELETWGPGASVRAGLAVARLMLPLVPITDLAFLTRAVDALEAWIASGDEEARRVVQSAELRAPSFGHRAVGVVENALAGMTNPLHAQWAALSARELLALEHTPQLLAGLRVRGAIRDELLPWALSQREDVAADPELLRLRRRWRSGKISRRRLDLAAFLGHGLARETLGAAAPPDGSHLTELFVWAVELEAFPQKIAVRAAVAAARCALPVWEAAVPDDPRPRAALEAAAAWVRRSNAKTRERTRVATREPITFGGDTRVGWAAESCLFAAAACHDPRGRVSRAILRAADASDDASVRSAVTESLLAWALG